MENSNDHKTKIKNIDKNLSKRHIELDPKGYFIIKIDQNKKTIIVEHYLNNINKDGLAIDPKTKQPIKCNKKETRKYNKIFMGSTAKEVGILITEMNHNLISKHDHSLYLARELEKAQLCIINNCDYVQD